MHDVGLRSVYKTSSDSINELVRLLKQDDIITHLVLLAKTVPDSARCERAYLDDVVEQAEWWLRCTSYDIPYIRISRQ